MTVFLDEFSHFHLSFCSNTTDEVIVLGDFNVHFGVDTNSRNLVDLLDQYGLSQMVNDATRISGYTLDLIFSNPFSLPLQPHVAEDLSETRTDRIKFDHFPILFQIADHFEANSSPVSISYKKSFRKLNQIDKVAFTSALGNKLSSDFAPLSNSFSQC